MRRALLGLGAALSALGVAEGWARWSERDIRLVDDGRLYTEWPGEHGADADGFPEREPPPPGRTIAVLGDSVTWGTGTPAEAWPRQMEEALGAGWTVLNFSTYGYDTAQEAATLPWALAAHPAYVFVATYPNDVHPTRWVELGGRPVYVAADRAPFALVRLWQGARAARAPADDDWDAFTDALRRIVAGAGGVPVYVVGLRPHVLSGGPPGCLREVKDSRWCLAQAKLADHQRAIAGELDLPYLDPSRTLWYRDEDAWWPDDGHVDRDHYSVAGQAVLGRIVADVFRAWTDAHPG